jgi:RNA polymerase sigma factor (sigma-70 family)
MAHLRFAGILEHIRNLAVGSSTARLDDRQLLERFLSGRDQWAFESLMHRHGPMVLSVCRRFLRDMHDAEDAFQATFLVLLRKARSLSKRELLANWLYGVAYRTALRARRDAARRHLHETRRCEKSLVTEDNDRAWREHQETLDEEIHRLPAKYRAPIVLCYFEGLTLKEAAQQLGWPTGTVAGRLARARNLLGARLTRRGVSLTAAGAVLALEENSRAAVPALLAGSTIQAATILTSKQAAGGAVISAPVMALTEGVLKVMFFTKLKLAAVVVGVTALSAGTGVVIYGRQVGEAAATPQTKSTPVPAAGLLPPDAVSMQREVDKSLRELLALTAKDGMPAIGEARANELLAKAKTDDKMQVLMRAQYEAALGEARARWLEFMAGRGTLSFFLSSSERLLEAERALSDKKADQVVAIENHWKRMRQIEKENDERFHAGRIPIQDALASRFYRVQAEIHLERARSELIKQRR